MIPNTDSGGGFEDINEAYSDFVTISVVVPIYNNPEGIRHTLNSLVIQKYPIDRFEIIVVDNGSTDNTYDIVGEYVNHYPDLIRLLREVTFQSSYAARNRGIESSKGTVIAFIDADMSVDTEWLFKINQSLLKDKWENFASAVEIYGDKKTIFEIYNKIRGFPIKSYVYNDHFAPTCCLVIRKRLFMDMGFFDPRLISSGDYEFGNRLYQAGAKIHYNPEIVMKHPARSTFRGLYEKSFRIGRGQRQLSIYYPDRYSNRIMNLKYYLPEIPWNFSRANKGNKNWEELSLMGKVFLYFIEWLLKLANNEGYWYETLKSK